MTPDKKLLIIIVYLFLVTFTEEGAMDRSCGIKAQLSANRTPITIEENHTVSGDLLIAIYMRRGMFRDTTMRPQTLLADGTEVRAYAIG